MAIKSGKNDGVVTLNGSGGDRTLHNKTNRTQVTAFNLKNNASVEVAIEIYISTDGTSASGQKVADITLEAGGSGDVLEMIGEGLEANYYVVSKITTLAISAGEVLSNLTYTLYTESS